VLFCCFASENSKPRMIQEDFSQLLHNSTNQLSELTDWREVKRSVKLLYVLLQNSSHFLSFRKHKIINEQS